MEYKIIYSDRKTLALQIKRGELVVRAPRGMSEKRIEEFVRAHSRWIEKHMPSKREAAPRLSEAELAELYAKARALVPERVALYAERLGVSYGRITVRCQTTRWGSCSAKGNLNFNCLLLLAPQEVLDSVVAHELCHLKEMNHSDRFYKLLLSVFPNYYRAHAWLKEHGSSLMEMAGK